MAENILIFGVERQFVPICFLIVPFLFMYAKTLYKGVVVGAAVALCALMFRNVLLSWIPVAAGFAVLLNAKIYDMELTRGSVIGDCDSRGYLVYGSGDGSHGSGDGGARPHGSGDGGAGSHGNGDGGAGSHGNGDDFRGILVCFSCFSRNSFYFSKFATIALALAFILIGVFCGFAQFYISELGSYVIDGTGIYGIDHGGPFVPGPFLLAVPVVWGIICDFKGVIYGVVSAFLFCQLSILVESLPLFLSSLLALAVSLPMLVFRIFGSKVFPFVYGIFQILNFSSYLIARSAYIYDYAVAIPILILSSAAMIFVAWRNRFVML